VTGPAEVMALDDVLGDGYRAVRSLTEELAAPLSAEDQTVQSMPDVSPTKWHRAHTTWFFETFLLEPNLPGYRPHHPRYSYLFNSYYEGVGARYPRHERGHITRPGVAEVAAYRRAVDGAMDDLLARPLAAPVVDLVVLGLHHEQQHQELLLMDIKHVLARNPLLPAYGQTKADGPGEPKPLTWTEHAGGIREIGHPGSGFAFDNELPRHRTYLEPFALADRPVTNGEWLAFMDDGGYERPELWLSDGWIASQTQHWDRPLYWLATGDRWQEFTLGGAVPLDPAAPVCHVSYYEADAFARWAGDRLPTEAEWEVAAEAAAGRDGGADDGLLDVHVLHPRPAVADPTRITGDVWQWTASDYAPYPGFTPAAGAVGEYNGKFMVNQQVLRGGSCATPLGHVRPTYRNFFPPAARWPFSGLRLARSG
jgi:ergothioneine biosynthesis protein EgtB